MSLNEFEKLFLCLNFEIAKKTDWRSFFFQSVKPVSCQWMTKYQNEKDSTYPAREEKKSWKEIRVWVRKVSSPSSFAKHSTVTSVRTFWLDRCEIVILSFFKFLQSFSPRLCNWLIGTSAFDHSRPRSTPASIKTDVKSVWAQHTVWLWKQ